MARRGSIAMAMAASLWASPGRGQDADEAAASRPGDRPPIVFAIVEWRIKRGQEAAFLDYWSTKSVVDDRRGLVGEFLSDEAEAASRFPWIRWADRSTPEYSVYYNVGIWRSEDDYSSQIAKYIDLSKPPLPFEYDHRHRILVDPVAWRRGPAELPQADSPGVR